MNIVLYKTLIEPWIPLEDRPILQRRNRWLIANNRINKNPIYHLLLADICIHHGVCDRRYCTCKYFSAEDRIDCFDRIYRSKIRILYTSGNLKWHDFKSALV